MGIRTVLVERAPMERLARHFAESRAMPFRHEVAGTREWGEVPSGARYDFPIEGAESICPLPPYSQRLELRSTSRPISAPATPPTIVPVARLRPPSIARPTRAPAAAPTISP